MKKLLFGLGMIAIAVMVFAVINGCQKEGDLTSKNAPNAFKTSSTVVMPDADAIQAPVMIEGTATSPIAIANNYYPAIFDISVELDPVTNDFVSAAPGDADFLKFLNSFKLTTEQKGKLDKALITLKNCRIEFYSYLKKSNQEIINKANRSRDELIGKFKKKLITEAQLKRELAELNKKTKAALELNSSKKVIIAGLTKCFDNYMATLKTILTTEQWTKLEAWYNSHK